MKSIKNADKIKKETKKNNAIKNIPKENDSIVNENENLESYLNQLKLLNLILDKNFEDQKINAEYELYDKMTTINKLREENFNLNSKLMSMQNIMQIEEYFNAVYSKIIELQPKIANFIENIGDLIENINFGLDKLYIDDNIIVDYNILEQNIKESSNQISELLQNNSKHFEHLEEIKDNFNALINIFTLCSENFFYLKTKLSNNQPENNSNLQKRILYLDDSNSNLK
jgi:hypothetical protein